MELTTENYAGSDADGWPYFDLQGFEYWFIVLTVVSFGLVGNAFSFFLMSDAQFSPLSYPVYLKSLAVCDSGQLIIRLVEQTTEQFDFPSISNGYDVTCKLWQYARYITLLMSPWLIVGLTLDRFVCVVFPLTRDKFCTKRKALIFCLSLLFLSAMVMLPILTHVKLVDGYCRGPMSVYYVFFAVRLLLSSTLPCLLILVFNVVIIARIRRSALFRKSFASGSTTTGRNSQDSSTRPLVLISVIAFATLLPMSVSECVEILLQMTEMDYKALLLAIELWPAFHVVYLLNFALNFYILMASSSNYRKILSAKIKCFDGDSRHQQQKPDAVSPIATISTPLSPDTPTRKPEPCK